MTTKEKRLDNSFFLLSQNNYWDSIRLSYDILMNELFIYVSETTDIRQYSVENEGVTALCQMYNFLSKKRIENLDELLRCLRVLTVSFNSYSRQVLDELFNSKQTKILAANFISLVTYIQNKSEEDSLFYFGGMPRLLLNKLTNNSLQNTYALINPFFEINFVSKTLFGRDFWNDIDLLTYENDFALFSKDELGYLIAYKEIVQENQLHFSKDISARTEDIWRTALRLEDVIERIKLNYNINILVKDLNDFRKYDLSSGKSNVYKIEKERGFHKNIYPFLAKCDYDIVMSEMNSSYHRHDIVLYNHEKSISAIVELKVNNLSGIADDLEQIITYLDKTEDRHKLYNEKPSFGALAVYYIGDEKKINKIDLCKILPERNLRKLPGNFYLYIPLEGAPIIITIFNGKD